MFLYSNSSTKVLSERTVWSGPGIKGTLPGTTQLGICV